MFKKSNVGDQLLIAVKLNKISEISRLVALGVDVNSRIDKNGKTALHFAAHKGQLLAVRALIEAGADLDITDENGVTALHRAIIHGHAGIVHTLLEAGCSVDETDENGNTALHEAAWNGYSKCVELLVAAKCNVNVHNRTGYTSLHLATQNCHCTTLQVLLDGGSNPLVKNNYGDTPLHIAVRYGHTEVCNMLMETKINISEQNNDGNTPLHIAASMGHEKLTEMLLKAGCIATVKNNVGDTARELAVRNGFKKIAKLLAPSKGDTIKMFSRKERGRPHSADVSCLFSGTTDSTLTTTATHLWVPKPVSLDPDSKRQGHKRDFVWSRRRKEERKPKVLTIKYDEMCSIERDYLKKRNASMRKSHKSQSKSSIKSQEERFRSDPVLHQKTKKSHSPEKVDRKAKSAQSRDDLEASLSHKKSKKDKGFFSLFRSASDTDLNIDDKKNGVCGKKHKDKYPPYGELMGNGVHRVGKEVKEKGDTEETKERKEKRRSEKSEEKTEKKERTGKKNREDDKEKIEKKEKRKEKEKEKKLSRRDENDGSESDCTICQEKRRKSREKSHSKESRHREQRSKSEHRRTKDHKETEYDKTPLDRKDEEKEHKKKKHHKDKERDKEHRDKDGERDHRDKDRDKDRSRRDKNHRRKTEEQEEDFGPTPCNQTHCTTCQAQLSRLEAWQERCTSEIDSARRRLEHRLQRLEKKLEEQLWEERQLKEKKESRDKELDRAAGPVKEQSGAVSKNVKNSSGNVKEEIRGLIKGGLTHLASLTTSGSSSRATSGIRVSDSGSLDTVIEARPVNDKGLRASGTIIEARPIDDEGLDTVIEAQPVIEDENDVKINDTYAATQVQHQRQVQEVEKWWRAKAEEEQRVLYARICELEQMLLMSRAGGDCFV
ncbi:ankyrin repeat domain-containing protein 24-like isoform X2 [Orbicella faveolata]|uniref:ankyrin repeat domain-containing protein 24-like isoform X2 n=1 Tax=Orbicella faveolata TaxID=48498 RepID=UPI0009E33C9F|nr:ankyrin repeat domain-containing protein 24-like isoform X2 [Orbicella faveolata]